MKNMYTPQRWAFLFCFLLSLFSFNAFAQVGIGNTDPKTALDVSGALSLREGPAITLSNGVNSNISLGTTAYSYYRITGPTAAFSINGIVRVTGSDGQMVTLVNTTNFPMTITSNSSGGGAKVVCPSDADLILTGANASVTLQYSNAIDALGKWVVVGYSNATGYGRNVYNSTGATDIDTNSNAFTNMTDMSITFTPKHSTVYVNFSASGTMDKGANFDSNAYANFQLRQGSTSIAGTSTLATDRSNYNNCQVTDFPFTETFEANSTTFGCWSEDRVQGNEPWYVNNGAAGGTIASAHGGIVNLLYIGGNTTITKMITPIMDISGLTNPTLTFWHGQETRFGGNRQLRVYYRISETDPWVQIANYTAAANNWTLRNLALPSASSTYQVAFEGRGNNTGRYLVLDDVTVSGDSPVNTKVLETAWNSGFTMYPVSVTPGTPTTISIRWLRDGNFPNVLRNNVATDADRSHRNLTILD